MIILFPGGIKRAVANPGENARVIRAFLRKWFRKPPEPALHIVRAAGHRAAVLLIHGWTAKAESAFGALSEVLVRDAAFASWDVYRLQYRSELRLNVPLVWSEPDIPLLGAYLATRLTIEPLCDYESLLLVGHSMGGLVVQSALLEASARRHVGYAVLLGTPSDGVRIPVIRRIVQLRDLAVGSAYLRDLRRSWDAAFADRLPFRLAAVAGNNDSLVQPESSLKPFPEACRMVIAGDHATIAAVRDERHELIGVLHRMLRHQSIVATGTDSAMIALEERRYQAVIATLGPTSDTIDENALVTLALAYDAIGETATAIAVLNSRPGLGGDALGTLAGRYKRRWLAARDEPDLSRCRALYTEGLESARSRNQPGQVMYHAINLAFLAVMTTPESSNEPPEAHLFADEARAASSQASPSYWSAVTNAEALLISGEYDAALAAYRLARDTYPALLRERNSSYLNAREIVFKRRRDSLDEKLAAALFSEAQQPAPVR